ncbi:tlde1 domain-containing protein [uncultured Roseibium sp.]|uniref:tlde1 domain-containing protein n=1 Tax=uncultured Roseibium sp. TaxID=1936171 RepID=UPI002623BC01|nr:tlde1 domain-containing protein [uncultured Roseibium sp.]
MPQNKQCTSRRRHVTPKTIQRTFLTALGGATLLIAGFAAIAAFMNPAMAPAQFAKLLGSVDELASAQHSGFASLDKDAQHPAAQISDQATIGITLTGQAGTVAVSSATASFDVAAEREASAKKIAKEALAAKLAHMKLARSLLAAQKASQLAEALPAPTVTVAANQSVGTLAEALVTTSAEAPVSVVASIATSSPIKPGAILPPAPAVKPNPPRRAKPASRATADDSVKPRNTAPALAYAAPGDPKNEEAGVFSGIGKLFNGARGGLPGRGSGIAVYDISAATVHMPDGTKLEAHSGIGHRMDNPKYAYVKNLGPTPPNVYKLRMRERRFHGVEAIRMLPLDKSAMKGRDGMLTHTRLLRNSIGSHGCVAFKDYNKFLRAYKSGKVKTLIVVPSMNKLPTYMAKLQRQSGA